MNFLKGINIISGAFATDGGSISLLVTDSEGSEHTILLSQHLLPFCGYPGERLPGRLFLNGEIIGVRSENERIIISALKDATFKPHQSETGQGVSWRQKPNMTVGEDIKAYHEKISQGPDAALRHLVNELLKYVESDQYVAAAENDIEQS